MVRPFWWSSLLLAFVPLLLLGWFIFRSELGPDPGLFVIRYLGHTAIIGLCVVLWLSPLKEITGWLGWVRIRRLVGLAVFSYASLHLLMFASYLAGWDWAIFLEEVSERPYVIVGMAAWGLLLPLALTSTNWAMRTLRHRWKQLHRFVYAIAVLAVVHVIWLVRSDYLTALVYSLLLLVALLLRVGLFQEWVKRPVSP